MIYEEYEYEYHEMVEDTDYIDQDDDIYYDNGIEEPWIDACDEDENPIRSWENYYDDIIEDIDD